MTAPHQWNVNKQLITLDLPRNFRYKIQMKTLQLHFSWKCILTHFKWLNSQQHFYTQRKPSKMFAFLHYAHTTMAYIFTIDYAWDDYWNMCLDMKFAGACEFSFDYFVSKTFKIFVIDCLHCLLSHEEIGKWVFVAMNSLQYGNILQKVWTVKTDWFNLCFILWGRSFILWFLFSCHCFWNCDKWNFIWSLLCFVTRSPGLISMFSFFNENVTAVFKYSQVLIPFIESHAVYSHQFILKSCNLYVENY